ncbi:MAG TPA: ATP-binding protein [Rhodanobacteraceae bacterium]|nr:ATP-binding protein [Rhodanobacteraceae bacterium]
MAKSSTPNRDAGGTEYTYSEFYFANLFRVLQGTVYTGLAFSPLALEWVRLREPGMARLIALIYLAIGLVALVRTRSWLTGVQSRVIALVSIDIAAALLSILAMHDSRTGIAMMLVISIAGAALLLPLRAALGLASMATIAVLGHTFFDGGDITRGDREVLEAGLFGLAYFASALLCHVLARQMRATEALATQRGVDLANLSQVNELIIRRMRTGVLLVDDSNHIHQINESAWLLLGTPPAEQRDLGVLAPELSRRLFHWRTTGRIDETAVTLADGVPEVVPRFTRLAANDDSHMLIFLDDTSLVSRRAEEMTLASLGRLSASIAHEIRNPLAAIRYSAQLLAESEELPDADKRMVEIINNHCGRLNEIIENILQLSRRERSRPETLDLNAWVLGFVDEYCLSNDLGGDSLRAVVQNNEVGAVADPQHLQQVIWNLVQNALRYGRLPGQPARVIVVARHDKAGAPVLEVADRGPGIPQKVAAQIFEPFFTTHEYGTGLGLYLAKQMCEANQSTLEYVPVAGGGSCFRITLVPPAQAPRST